MKTKVRDWMTRRPVTIDARATVLEALQLLKERRIRRLPVTRRGTLVGLVTDTMLLAYSAAQSATLEAWEVAHLLSTKLVSEVMNPYPHSVAPDTDLAECAPLIRDRKLGGGLTVLDENGNLVGILTTTDALEALMWFCGQVHTP